MDSYTTKIHLFDKRAIRVFRGATLTPVPLELLEVLGRLAVRSNPYTAMRR